MSLVDGDKVGEIIGKRRYRGVMRFKVRWENEKKPCQMQTEAVLPLLADGDFGDDTGGTPRTALGVGHHTSTP